MKPQLWCLGLIWLGVFSAANAQAKPDVPPTRVAIISAYAGKDDANTVALAVAALSGDAGIALVERDAVEHILREQNLWRSGLSEARQALAVGRLLNVDVFVSIEAFNGTKGLPGLVAFDAKSGVRISDVVLTSTNIQAQAAEIAAAVRSACGKRSQLGTQARTVCVLAVRNTGVPQELNSACEAAGRLLEQLLVASPNLAVLERQRLEQVNQERSLPGAAAGNDLRLALTMLDLEISRTPDGKGFRGVVFLSDSVGKVLEKVSASLVADSPARLSEALLPDLLKALHSEASAGKMDRGSEAQRFVSESQFLLSNGGLPGAMRMAEAASALDEENSIVQTQLANCLYRRAMAGLNQDKNDFKHTLPIAARALEICRQELLKLTARNARAESLLTKTGGIQGTILSTLQDLDEKIWPVFMERFERQDRETQNDLLVFQQQLREVRTRLARKYWRSQITGSEDTRAEFEGNVEGSVCDLASLSPTSAIWTASVMEIMSEWMEVFDQYPATWGGWSLGFLRPLATVCWAANDCSLRLTNLDESEVSPRLGRWQLQPENLEQLTLLFRQMDKHRNPIVQCYGRIGRLASALRGQKTLSPATRQEYISAKEFIRTKIAELGSLPDKDYLRYHSYSAARDLIDLLPDADFRRKEHLELFELMLKRRDVSYWTAFMAVSPKACRFAQYRETDWPVPFPLDPVGYTAKDYSMLHANRVRLLEVYNSTNRHDLDARRLSHSAGSFPRAVAAWCKPIYTQRPDLAASIAKPLPWTKAETIFDATPTNSDSGILAMLTDESAAYAVVGRSKNNSRLAECYRIPLDGKTPSLFGTVPLTSQIKGIRSAITPEALYLGVPETGIFEVPLHGGPVKKYNQETGLPSDHVGAFTVAEGKLYTQLKEGHLVSLDLKSHLCDILATKRSKEKRSPLDEAETGFEIIDMFSDPARHRVLFTTRFKGELRNSYPLTGLWQIDTATGKFRQLIELYYPADITVRNDSDHLLLYGRRNDVEPDTHPPFESIVSYQLSSDTARVAWVYFGPRRKVGPALAGDSHTVASLVYPRTPFLIADNWLWTHHNNYSDEQSPSSENIRLSLSTSEIQEFTPPKDMSGWKTLYQLPGGKRVLGANKNQIHLLTLP